MTNTNNLMVHKTLSIDNATLFMSRFKYSRSCSEIECSLWSSCIWIQNKIGKLHITLKSLLRHNYQTVNGLSNKQQISAKDFLFYEHSLFQLLENRQKSNLPWKYSLLFYFKGKSSKNILVMKLTDGSAEHLQQNFAGLPPQYPEKGLITNCLEETTFPPVHSALKFVRCDQQSRLFLQTSLTFLRFFISTEAKMV